MTSLFRAIGRGAEQMGDAITKVSDSAERMAQSANAYRIKTEAMLAEEWFSDFRVYVGGALKRARALVELEEQLDADPVLKEIYLGLSNSDDPSVPVVCPVPDWIKSDLPTETSNLPDDPEIAALYRQGFEMALLRHENFVSEIGSEIEGRPALRKAFLIALSERGLDRVIDVYFKGSPTRP